VQRILGVYNELSAKHLVGKLEIPPSQYAVAMKEFCRELETQDFSDCPADFRVACTQNIRAIREGEDVLRRYPEKFGDAFAMGLKNYILRGEIDSEVSRLSGDMQDALKHIRATSDEVERIAAKYIE
jgi:hypothetical protein